MTYCNFNSKFRPSANYIYPPYHEGPYIEEYFYKYSKIKNYSRKYIDIFWTDVYLQNTASDLQYYLDQLDKSEKYFTVCQHDDAPLHSLPNDTLIFNAGGNTIIERTIPIPLIASPIPNLENLISCCHNKDILCSFVGSLTHDIRNIIYETLNGQEGFIFSVNGWNINVSLDRMNTFINLGVRSKYILCPRGYGATSFRLYEAMQLNAVPIYISNYFHLPWQDELDWNKFCILLTPDEINKIPSILKSIKEDKRLEMVEEKNKIYSKYFTLDGMCQQIEKRIA